MSRGSRMRCAAAGVRGIACVLLAGAGVALGAPIGRAPQTGGSAAGPREPSTPAPSTPATPPFAVGVRVLRLIDASRFIRLPDGRTEARTLTTYVRYPALGRAAGDVAGATPARAAGPFPLIVFGHGFASTPAIYARLLRGWAQAGYVVAAPLFPLENANAPGGPDESDLINQPTDMSLVISRLLALSAGASSPLSGLIDAARIAVSGQSDGGETALAVADSRRFRDRRVDAAVILSGAELSGVGGFSFRGGPPLLASQGTADTINEPRFTYAFFKRARRPKYLLRLLGAGHLPPYTDQQPQLDIVRRVTLAFLDRYLKHGAAAVRQLAALANVPGVATLGAEP
jgi:dienelactone hydrolase